MYEVEGQKKTQLSSDDFPLRSAFFSEKSLSLSLSLSPSTAWGIREAPERNFAGSSFELGGTFGRTSSVWRRKKKIKGKPLVILESFVTNSSVPLLYLRRRRRRPRRGSGIEKSVIRLVVARRGRKKNFLPSLLRGTKFPTEYHSIRLVPNIHSRNIRNYVVQTKLRKTFGPTV